MFGNQTDNDEHVLALKRALTDVSRLSKSPHLSAAAADKDDRIG
jgi:hypothetical protein